MTLSLTLACLWVLAATVTALLPMRRQYVPGVTLLLLAPVLLVWIGMEHGLWVALGCMLAVLSLFRHPLRYLGRKALGLPVASPGGDPR